MYPVTNEYGYRLHLTLKPDASLKFVSRVAPPDKKRGDSVRLAPVAAAFEPSPRAAGGGTLAVSANFTAAQKPPKKKSGYGHLPAQSSKFTSRAKDSVRQGAAAIERHWGIAKCFFATLSLPGGSDLAMLTFSLWSSWLMDLLNKFLARHCRMPDGNCYRVSVWEMQKRGALHLHLLIVSMDDSFIDKLNKYYISLLEKLSDITGVDMFERRNGSSWRGRTDSLVKAGRKAGRLVEGFVPVSKLMCDVKPVTKSVSAYLSKYLSKGSSRVGQAPARWWSMSNCVRRLVALYTIQFPLGRTNSDAAGVIDEFVQGVFETCHSYAASLRNIGRENEFRTGFVAWDSYDKLRDIGYAVQQTILGHLAQVGHLRGASELRFECAIQPVRAGAEKRRIDSDFYAELALDRVMNGRFAEQMRSARAGVCRDYAKRFELRQVRKQLDDIKVNVIVNQKVNTIVNDKKIASVIQLWNSDEYKDRLKAAREKNAV